MPDAKGKNHYREYPWPMNGGLLRKDFGFFADRLWPFSDNC